MRIKRVRTKRVRTKRTKSLKKTRTSDINYSINYN
jgi:hypothetical protein